MQKTARATQIKDSLFYQIAMDNPIPTLVLDPSGRVLFANPASRGLLSSLHCEEGQSLPPDWQERVQSCLAYAGRLEFQGVSGEHAYTFTLIPNPSAGQVCLYARQISPWEGTNGPDWEEEAQRRLSELALLERSARLQVSETLFRSTFENASVGITHVSLDGRWLRVNEEMCQITGYSRSELLQKTFQEITHPLDLDSDLEQMQQVLRGEIAGYRMEKRYLRKDGQMVWVILSTTLMRDEQGQPLYFIAVVQDNHPRKQMEAHDHFLIELASRLARAITPEAATAITVDQLGRYLGVDRCLLMEVQPGADFVSVHPDYHPGLRSAEGSYSLAGFPPGVMADLQAGKQVIVEDAQQDARTRHGYQQFYQPMQSTAYVHTPVLRGGQWAGSLLVTSAKARAWLETDLHMLQSVNDLLWLTLDKTRLLARVSESEARLRLALERSGMVVFEQDHDLRYVWITNPPDRMREADFIGKTDAEALPGNDEQWLAKIKREVIATGSKATTEARVVYHNRVYYYDLVLEAARNSEGEVVGIVGSGLDITERKRAEQAISDYARRLERSNGDLQSFAFVASHDLQEPLRKVKSFGDLLSQHYSAELEPTGLDYLGRMLNAASRMQQMIDGLLDYSRISTRAAPFREVNLSRTARDVLEDLETRIAQNKGQVEVGDLPTIEAEPLQMRQLLQNLISNGLKFHQSDTAPEVRVLAESDEPGWVKLIVTDKGVGFDMQHLERIFQPFQRLHGRSEYDGSGIGLAICRRIAERHGGSITAESQPGQGSRFIARLPVKQASAAA